MNILDQIAEKKRERISTLKKDNPYKGDTRRESPVRTFPQGDAFIIAECKKASPSKGTILPEYNPASIARQYSTGGAAAISVLTEEDFFSGSAADLATVRESVMLPVLRKDFILESWQVRESYAIGADAILLIASLLERHLMADLYCEAREMGMAVLVEAHNEDEIGAAAECGSVFIGVNARNLKDFQVSTEYAARLASYIPAGRIAIAESGITSADALLKLRAAGYRGFLIGEHFMRAEDHSAAVREFNDTLRFTI